MSKENVTQEDLWCEYSDLPSPKAYINCADYDSMGNHGRFPKSKDKKNKNMKRILQKIVLWVSLKRKKNKRKTIWKL